MDIIREFLNRQREKRLTIRCIGDAVVDQYYQVDVNRISPEFPMPIMRSYDREVVKRPGGVANVAFQLKHFNVDTQLACFTDDLLNDTLWENPLPHCDHEGSVYIESYGGYVPRKKRYLHGGVQICRRDVEADRYGFCENALKSFQENLHQHQRAHFEQPPDVVLFSDYNKGVFVDSEEDWISDFQAQITIVDTKALPIKKWRGCTIFKPNKKEAAELSGRKDWHDQCRYFMDELDCKHVVITCGGDGVVGCWGGQFFEYRPDFKVQVESVIGAGDCFAAVISMAVGHGFEGREAAEIAYRAGAVYVQQKMNRPVVPAELVPDGIVEPEDLRRRDFKLVFTNGCFDILHAGHIQSFRFAKSKGEKLVVALNTDDSVRRFKGPTRPKNTLQHRMALVSAIKEVDFVTYFDEINPVEVLKKIQPDVQVKGKDWEGKEIPEAGLVPELCFAPLIDGLSTTSILAK
jgi:D-beta-D-heptose 7-phosphate kinase/D-beta-D-heptose 1-phosphate adenosyltransferase